MFYGRVNWFHLCSAQLPHRRFTARLGIRRDQKIQDPHNLQCTISGGYIIPGLPKDVCLNRHQMLLVAHNAIHEFTVR